MLIRLVNFVSAMSGVRSDLCRFLVDCLNDDLTPWIPSLGHGMAADAIANTQAFQTFIGEGFVFAADGKKQAAAEALSQRGVESLQLVEKEGLALLNGISAAAACAFDAQLSARPGRDAGLAYEMLAALTAIGIRKQKCGKAVQAIKAYFDTWIKPLDVDRSPGPDVELILERFASLEFRHLLGDLLSKPN